jgi:hypothetical protein
MLHLRAVNNRTGNTSQHIHAAQSHLQQAPASNSISCTQRFMQPARTPRRHSGICVLAQALIQNAGRTSTSRLDVLTEAKSMMAQPAQGPSFNP